MLPGSALTTGEGVGVEPWMESAACAGVDPELFFPDKGAPVKAPKRVCAGCPVAAECLAFARRTGVEHGVWGGLSAIERKRLRRAS